MGEGSKEQMPESQDEMKQEQKWGQSSFWEEKVSGTIFL